MKKHRKRRVRATPARFIPPTQAEVDEMFAIKAHEPRSNCSHCHGRGWVGRNHLSYEVIRCTCLDQHPPGKTARALAVETRGRGRVGVRERARVQAGIDRFNAAQATAKLVGSVMAAGAKAVTNV